MFVQRSNGAITGIWTARQFDGQEELREDSRELQDFVARSARLFVLADLRVIAIHALRTENLQDRMSDPNAPQEVKDYKREIEKE